MNTDLSTLLFILGYLAFMLSPVIVAHLRQHPKRNLITGITLLTGLFCPTSIGMLVWACLPFEKPVYLTQIEED